MRHKATLDSILSLKAAQSNDKFQLSQQMDNIGVDMGSYEQRHTALKKQVTELAARVNSVVSSSSSSPPVHVPEPRTESGIDSAEVDARTERIVAAAVAAAVREEQMQRRQQVDALEKALAAERKARQNMSGRLAKLEAGAVQSPRGKPAPPPKPPSDVALAKVQATVNELKKRLEATESAKPGAAGGSQAAEVGAAVSELESSLESVQSSVSRLSERLLSLESGKANTDSNANLKYQQLEQKLNAQQKQLLLLRGSSPAKPAQQSPVQHGDATDDSELRQKVASLSAVVGRLDISFSAVDSRVDAVGRKLEQLVSTTSKLEAQVSSAPADASAVGSATDSPAVSSAVTERLKAVEQALDQMQKGGGAHGNDATPHADAVTAPAMSDAISQALKTVRTEAAALELKIGNLLKQRDTNVSKLKIQCRNLATENSRDRTKATNAVAAAKADLSKQLATLDGRISNFESALQELKRWQADKEQILESAAGTNRGPQKHLAHVVERNTSTPKSPKTTIMKRAVIPTTRRANTGVRPLWRMWEDIDEEVQRELDACHTLLISRSQALETGDSALMSEVRSKSTDCCMVHVS